MVLSHDLAVSEPSTNLMMAEYFIKASMGNFMSGSSMSVTYESDLGCRGRKSQENTCLHQFSERRIGV